MINLNHALATVFSGMIAFLCICWLATLLVAVYKQWQQESKEKQKPQGDDLYLPYTDSEIQRVFNLRKTFRQPTEDNKVIQESVLNPMNHCPKNRHPYHQLIDSMKSMDKTLDEFEVSIEEVEDYEFVDRLSPKRKRLEKREDELVEMYFDDEVEEKKKNAPL